MVLLGKKKATQAHKQARFPVLLIQVFFFTFQEGLNLKSRIRTFILDICDDQRSIEMFFFKFRYFWNLHKVTANTENSTPQHTNTSSSVFLDEALYAFMWLLDWFWKRWSSSDPTVPNQKSLISMTNTKKMSGLDVVVDPNAE